MNARTRARTIVCGLLTTVFVLLSMGQAMGGDRSFSFARYLFDEPSTLSTWVVELDHTTGYALVNGVDTQGPSIPFTWNWGDDVIESGWFPQSHVYEDVSRNYVCTVTAHYAGGATDSTQVLVRFVPPEVNPVPLPDETAVSVPDTLVELVSRMPGYGIPDGLTPFGEESFTDVPRPVVEYVLSVAADVQKDMVNGDVFMIDGGFRQVVLHEPGFGGMYSLWYTSPVSFAAGDYAFEGTVQWSSFLHEMGHNLTLNFPAGYYYGGKIDGCANAIYSETMAQIFQHATAYDIANLGASYGLSADLIFDVEESAVQSIGVVRAAYERYLAEGMNFASWNDPATPEDETFDTFMTLAYEFCAHAEWQGEGYRIPTKRVTWLLSVFDAELEQRYDQQNDTAEADSFRATLMVAGLSFAFDADLRDEFRDLNFPISDATYEELLGMVTGVADGSDEQTSLGAKVACAPNPMNPRGTIAYLVQRRGGVTLRVYDIRGREVCTLVDRVESPGWHEIEWSGTDGEGRDVASGVYMIRLTATGRAAGVKTVLLR
jgi:hypothetical protein